MRDVINIGEGTGDKATFMRGYYMLSFLRMRRHRALLSVVLLLGSVLGAHAHPHIWIDAYVDLNLGPDGLERSTCVGCLIRFLPVQ